MLPVGLRRKITALLLLFLLFVATVFAASALSSVSSSLAAPLFASVRSDTPEKGMLFLDILLGVRPYNNFTPLDLPAYYAPIPFEVVSLSRTDQPGVKVEFRTNFTGLLRLQLPVSDSYQVEVNDTRFHAVVPFSIHRNEQTNVVIRGNRNASLAVFQESQDASSTGWITTTSRIFMTVYLARPIPTNSVAIFLETEKATGLLRSSQNLTADRTISQTPLHLISQEQRASQLWLTVSPQRPIALAGLIRIFVVTYAPSFSVSFGTNLS